MIVFFGILLIVILFVLHWEASIIVQSMLHHRGAAHNMFRFKNNFTKKFSFWIGALVLGPSYLNLVSYGIMHHMHHAYSDTDNDPHRPYDGFWGVVKNVLTTAKRYHDIHVGKDHIVVDGKRVEILEKFRRDLDYWQWQFWDKIFHSWAVRIFVWALIYGVSYYYIALAFEFKYVWPVVIVMTLLHSLMAPIHGAIVNYYAHKYGDAPHKTGDTSRNMPLEARIILALCGELLHNNHHSDQTNPDFSLGRKGEYDTLYHEILVPLHNAGIIVIKRLALQKVA